MNNMYIQHVKDNLIWVWYCKDSLLYRVEGIVNDGITTFGEPMHMTAENL